MSALKSIEIQSEMNIYDISQSKWSGVKNEQKKFKLAILFFSPDGCDISMPLASIAAYVKKTTKNIEIKLFPIFDKKIENGRNTIDVFSEGLFSWEPDLIAISLMSPHWYPMDYYLLKFKEISINTPILVGGYQATMAPDQTIAHEAVDFICVGDGEYPTSELIDFLRGNKQSFVNGLWEKQTDNNIHKSSPLQIDNICDLPFPDYSIFDHKGQFSNLNVAATGARDKFIFPVMTGRGCPYKCTYCCNTPLLLDWNSPKGFLRKYNPEDLIEELCRLRDKYGIEYFEFWDELFMSNLKFVKHFLAIYKEKIGLPFSINSRVEVMSEKFCQLVADAGCHTIWFGIESGDEEYRTQTLGRKMTNEKIILAAENCRKVGIQRLTFNIVGMPFETKEQMLSTLALNKIIKPEFFFFFTYIPLRGTPLYNTAKDAGVLISEDDKITQQHYLDTVDGKYLINIKSDVSDDDFNDVCQQMQIFQADNNRLTYKNIRPKTSHYTIPYPYNIYTHINLLTYGTADFFHYGLFKEGDSSIRHSHQNFVSTLIEQIPPSAKKILLVGNGVSNILDELNYLEYDVEVIIPDTNLSNYVEEQWKTPSVICTKLSDFVARPHSFDVVFLQESIEYTDPLVIFNQCVDCLVDTGALIVIDSFSLKTDEEAKTLCVLNDFIALAERFNFELKSKQDLSTLAVPTFDYQLAVIEERKEKIIDDLSLNPELLTQLVKSNTYLKQAYEKEVYGYILLHFKKHTAPTWRVKSFDPENKAPLQQLFNKSFNTDLSQNLWQWKYADDRSKQLCAWKGEQLIAHYGGMPRDILYFGEALTAIQIGDVMVDPSHRGALIRKGSFFKLAATFLERYIGHGKPFILGFGFPNERAMKVAENLKLYSRVDHMVEMSWPALSTRSSIYTYSQLIDAESLSSIAEPINTLWSQMSQDLQQGIVGVRDWPYVLNRYLNHPTETYLYLVVKNRLSNKFRGLIVLSKKGNNITIIDVISKISDIHLLIFHARRFTYSSDCTQLLCQISSGFSSHFQVQEVYRKDLDVSIPNNIWSDGPKEESLKQRWWLMSGDMDCR